MGSVIPAAHPAAAAGASAPACPACGVVGTWTPAIDRGRWVYARCDACALLTLRPPPPDEFLAGFYAEDYFHGASNKGGYADYAGDEATHRRNARARLDALEQSGARPPGVLVELGSAVGFLLDEARWRGWTVIGVDPSAWARAEAQRRFGHRVFPSVPEALERLTQPIDAVVALQVVEHMPDPVAAFATLRGRMRPEGRVVIETWDGGSWIARRMGGAWQQVTPPSVIHLFDRRSLGRLVARAGFAIDRVAVASKPVSARLVLGQLGEKLPALRGPLRALSASPLGRLRVAYRLGDLVVVTARPEAT